MVRDPFALAALLLATAAFGFWLDRRFRICSRVGAALLIILFGAALSNLGIVPRASPVYQAIEGPVLSLAIVFLLFSVNLADLKQAGPAMLAVFSLACVATMAGAFTGSLIFGRALGEETWKLAGVFTGTYTGGSLNFAAVARGLGLSASTFAAATAADNVTTTLWMAVTLAIPGWLAGVWRPRQGVDLSAIARPPSAALSGSAGHTTAAADAEVAANRHPYWGRVDVSLFQLVTLATAGAVVLLLSRWAAQRVPSIPYVLWLTTAALLAAQLPAVRAIRASEAVGNLGLHLFLVVIGVYSIVGELARVGPAVFYYTVWVVGLHGLILFALGRLLRADLGVLCVATQAAVGGPATAMAIAVARDWHALMLPGVAAGLLGYAVGNYLGFGVAYVSRWALLP